MKRILFVAFMLLMANGVVFGMERAAGWCEQGAQTITVLTYQSSATTPVQRSYPQCSVTVYITGTTTKASLFSTSTGSALSNPFVATANGYWGFYAANGTYDVQLSGAGIPTPFTLGAITLFDLANYIPPPPVVPVPASGGDTQIQYNKIGFLNGDLNLTWDYTARSMKVNGLVAGSFLTQANAANIAGGYLHLKPIVYPAGVTCLDVFGNPVNQPVPVGGDSFGPGDAVMWVSASPMAGVTPPGCAAALPVQEVVGLNTNAYLLSMAGLATTSDAYNSIQSLFGGEYVRLGYTADQGLYMQAHPTSATLLNPSALCVFSGTASPPATSLDYQPNCYGGFAYQGGSTFWYYNATAHAWNSVNFASVGGSPGGSNSNIQWNKSGAFYGDGNFTYVTGTPNIVTLAGTFQAVGTSAGFDATTCTEQTCVQAPVGGLYGKWVIASDSVFWLAEYAPAVSASRQAKVYFDSATHLLKVSQDGGPFVNLVGGGGGGTPGGTSTDIQSNQSGGLYGDANFTYVTGDTNVVTLNEGSFQTVGLTSGFDATNCTSQTCIHSPPLVESVENG